MATLMKRRSGKSEFWMIQFYDLKKNKKYISLSATKYNEKTAKELKEVVEILLYNFNNSIEVPSKKTEHWITACNEEIRNKLAKAGLIEMIEPHSCKELWDEFIREKTRSLKDTTLESYEATKVRFFQFYNEDEDIKDLTPERMNEFKESLCQTLAEATVCGTITKLRTVFNWALARKWIHSTPMEGVSRGSFVNRKNDRHISRDEYFRLLEYCPCQQWRVILALVRYGGMRCPSEVLRLRWIDVNWDENMFHVTSPKTERYEGGEGRIVPLFPEVRSELSELFFRKESEGMEFVINRYRDPERTNLGTQFARIVKMAGMTPIKRPFDNMRASRSNEINSRFGSFFETKWIGHSSKIARKHYLEILPEDISRAAEWVSGPVAGNSSTDRSPQNPPFSLQSDDSVKRPESEEKSEEKAAI